MLLPLALVAQELSRDHQKSAGLAVINEEMLSAQLGFLASDWTEGRETGTRGAYMAADYIASIFLEIGLKPGGDYAVAPRQRTRTGQNEPVVRSRTFFQNFPLIETRAGEAVRCGWVKTLNGSKMTTWLDPKRDFSFTPGQRGIEVQAEMVFVGYGIKDPVTGYNDYKGIDVNGKIVIRLQGFPGHRDPASKGYNAFNTGDPASMVQIERQKDQWAAEAGALAVVDAGSGRGGSMINVTPANIPFRYNEPYWEGEEPFRNTPRTRLSRPQSPNQSGLARLSLAPGVIEEILSLAGIDRTAFETNVAATLKPNSRALTGQALELCAPVESRVIQARNVIGFIEGKNKEACIVLGAHYDHVGMTRGFIYNGSDDNASGTVGIMTIARAIIASGIQPEVTLIFCAWTAEEKGLIGSAHYADNPLIKDIRGYMNYDMISRVAVDDSTKMKCDYNFSSGTPIFRELAEKHIVEYDLKLDMTYQSSPQPRGGSDFTSFSAKGIPIFLIHGKFTPDYHHFTDHADRAELPYMADIVRLGYLNIFELCTTNW